MALRAACAGDHGGKGQTCILSMRAINCHLVVLIAALPSGSGEAVLYEGLIALVPRHSQYASRRVTNGGVRR